MDFGFSDEQLAMRETASALFGAEIPRAAAPPSADERRRLWKQMAQLDMLALLAPASLSGVGLDERDLVLLLEAAGAALVPAPYLETAAIAVPLLCELGTVAGRERLVPGIASGELVASIQFSDRGLVAHADIADVLLCECEGLWYAVPSTNFTAVPRLTRDPVRPLFEVSADCDAQFLLGGDGSVSIRARARAAAGAAAWLNGVGRHLLSVTIEYDLARSQFGRQLGSLQVVKHKLADVHLAVEAARPTAWYAAYALASGTDDAAIAASVAKAAAADAARLAVSHAMQLHGAIGFTWEFGLHRWLKHAVALSDAYGSAQAHRDQIAAVLMPL